MARAVLCPRCRQLIGSDETVCSWCGTARSAPWWRLLNWSRGAMSGDAVVMTVMTVNVLFFALSLMIGQGGGLLSPSSNSLLLLGASGTVPIDHYGRSWSLLTANYLHGGILHLLFNMAALRQLAPWTAAEYGTSRMFVIYTLGGVCGYLVSYVAGVPFTIGASAAICSLAGALIYYGKSRGGSYGASVYRELGGWVVSIFVFGLVFPGINNWGHGGGLVGGALLGMLLGYTERRRESILHRLLAIACAAVTSVALAAVLVRLF